MSHPPHPSVTESQTSIKRCINIKEFTIKVSEEKTAVVKLLSIERWLYLLVAVIAVAFMCKRTFSPGRTRIRELDSKLQAISFDCDKLAVYVGDEVEIEPDAIPKNAEVSYTWEIADDGILGVQKGRIVAQKSGRTLLGIASGDVSAQIRVIAKYKPLPPDSTLPPLYYDKLMIANYKNTLNAEYVPANLVKIPDNYTADGYYGLYATQETFEAYKKLYKQMYSEIKGRMHIISAYRSYARQNELYNKAVSNLMAQGKTSTEARALALNTTQTPGNSEHQLGNTIDVSNDNTTDHDYLNTPEGRWLAENCYKYGFIIRYPKDKEDITRIEYEPWHIRYVGVNHAAYMYVNDLCLEQYVELQEEAEEAANDYALQNPATPD